MTTFLALKHKATFRTPTYTTSAAGQKKIASYTDTSVPCTFLYLATDEKTIPVQELEDIIEIIIGDSFTPSYSMEITNIKDRFGNIIEPGSLQIIGIKKYAGFAGKLHHYRLRTKRVKSC